MRVHVTQNHIDLGLLTRDTAEERECTCPVALAIQGARPTSTNVFVVYENVSYTMRGKRHTSDLPRSVSDFITAFDANRHVGPRSFNIPLEA